MQDTKVFSEIIKDSLEDLEKEIVEQMDVLEVVLQEKYKEDPFRMIHLIDNSFNEIEGMILGVFFHLPSDQEQIFSHRAIYRRHQDAQR